MMFRLLGDLRPGQRLGLLVLLVVALCVAVAVWFQRDQAVRAANRQAFDQDVDLLHGAVLQRMGAYDLVLRGAAGFWQATPRAGRADWAAYVAALDLGRSHPGIDAMTFTRHVSGGDRDAFIADVRARLDPGFEIHPPGARPDHFVITHIEPWGRTRNAIGYDVAAEPRRRVAAEAARDRGQAVMTAPLRLITAGNTSADFILFQPVYKPLFPLATRAERRAALFGWVAMGFHAQELLRNIQALTPDSDIALAIRARDPDGLDINLYQDLTWPADAAGVAFTAQRTLDIAGQQWLLEARSTPAYEAGLPRAGWVLLGVNVVLALAVTLGAALLLAHRERGLALARQTASRLDRTERRLARILDASPSVVYARRAGGDGAVTFVSRAIERFGFQAAAVTATPDWWIGRVDPDDRARVVTARDRLIDQGGPGRIELTYRFQAADGTWRWVVDRQVLVRDSQGMPREVVGTVSDITERRQAREALAASEALYRAMFESANIGISQATPDGVVVEVNATLAAMLGYGRQDLVGRRWAELTHPEDLEISGDLARRVLDGTQAGFRVHKRYLRADGSVMWADLSAYGLRQDPDGPVTLLIATIQDITEQRNFEIALEAKQAELERSNEDLQQFAYAASHDLQEPLRMISSYLTLLERRYGARFDDDAREFFGFAVDGAQRMSVLMRDLLDYARIQSRGQPPTPTDLNQVMAEVRANLDLAIAEADAVLDVPENLPTIPGDRSQLVRLFQNLMSNALKYRRAGQGCRITIGCVGEPGGWHLTFADDGIGLPGDQTGRIFQVFQRLHPRGRYEGTGIGLALCKRIVERHGGRIWAESPGPDQGSVFHVVLPG